MKKRITFSLPAEAVEGSSEVILLGDFNNWDPEVAPRLKKHHDESFIAVVELEVGNTYNYRFMSNDGRWINDYNAQKYEPAPGLHVDNCVITVTEDSKEAEAPAKSAPKKAVAAKPKAETKTSAPENSESVAAKAAKKAPVKAEASKSAKAKPAAAKPVAKKSAPKGKK
jgi:Glycogen recognition site of AMP-activated protein kinase